MYESKCSRVYFVQRFQKKNDKMSSENILSHFWDLASTDEGKRLKAASQLLCALDQAQRQHEEREKVIYIEALSS